MTDAAVVHGPAALAVLYWTRTICAEPGGFARDTVIDVLVELTAPEHPE